MGVNPVNGIEKAIPGYDAVRKEQRNTVAEQQAGRAAAGGDPVSVSLHRMSATMSKLETVNEEKNLFAVKIRMTDNALRQIEGTVGKMKSHLDTIVKNWPPFPQDSSERKDILMSYAALRKEILKMTFPAPPAPLYEKNTSLWDKLGYTDQNKLAGSVPDIPATATDEQVSAASAGLEKLQTDVSVGRRELVRAVTE